MVKLVVLNLEILDFFLRHWQLSSIFLVLLLSYIAFELKFANPENSISPQQVVGLYNHEHAIILDIRAKDAFTRGHILGAIHTPLSDLGGRMKKLSKSSKKPIVVVCSVGRDSPKVARKLKEEYGLERVLLLAGGMQAWHSADLPLSTK